jgi:hypothetical protein
MSFSFRFPFYFRLREPGAGALAGAFRADRKSSLPSDMPGRTRPPRRRGPESQSLISVSLSSLPALDLGSIQIATAVLRRLRRWPFKSKSSQRHYRDVGGTSDQRTQLSTARWPCAPNSRWQLSLMRSGMCSGSSGPQAVKRTSDNIKSNILI